MSNQNLIEVKLLVPAEVLRRWELDAEEATDDDSDFDVYDHCGGNIDDAYQLGETTGMCNAYAEVLFFKVD
jgi:hypothetical protein